MQAAFRVTLQEGCSQLVVWSGFPLSNFGHTLCVPQAALPFHLVLITFLNAAEMARQEAASGRNWFILVHGWKGVVHYDGEGVVCEVLLSGQMRHQKGAFSCLFGATARTWDRLTHIQSDSSILR